MSDVAHGFSCAKSQCRMWRTALAVRDRPFCGFNPQLRVSPGEARAKRGAAARTSATIATTLSAEEVDATRSTGRTALAAEAVIIAQRPPAPS